MPVKRITGAGCVRAGAKELAKRSLDALWQKKKMAVDGIDYTQDEIRRSTKQYISF